MGLTIAAVKYGKEFDHFKIGYFGFKDMREEIAPLVGYEYREGDNPFAVQLYCTNEKDFLTRFFSHSDCDGKIMQADLKKLYGEFKQIELKQEQDNFKEFLAFLKLSVNQKWHWEFY